MSGPYHTIQGNRLVFAPWRGEFGWEVMSWAPYCRALTAALTAASGGRRRAEITSFGSSRALYADFAGVFTDHGEIDRSLNYPKDGGMYRVCANPRFAHVRYGRPLADRAARYDVMLHARGARWRKTPTVAWSRFDALAARLLAQGLRVASFGTEHDYHVAGTADQRCNDLARDMDLLATASVAVGCSSGPLHLAAACGCALVVWGDTKTRYGQTLRTRYEKTWNPHHVRVGWLDADDWDPPVSAVQAEIAALLAKEPHDAV